MPWSCLPWFSIIRPLGKIRWSRRESLKNEAEAPRAEIETMLLTDRYKGAWKRAQTLELGNVVAVLLKENQDAPTIESNPTVFPPQ